MNFHEKDKIYQELIKSSPHLLEKYSPMKAIEKRPESPLEKLKNLRKEKMKDFSLKNEGKMHTKLNPRVKEDDVKLIAYELKLRFILKKIDINVIEKVGNCFMFIYKFFSIFSQKSWKLKDLQAFLR